MRQSTEEHRGASAAEFGTAAKEGAAFRRFPLHIGVIWAAATLRHHPFDVLPGILDVAGLAVHAVLRVDLQARVRAVRSEEHTSELQSLMRISYAVFCLKKKTIKTPHIDNISLQYNNIKLDST